MICLFFWISAFSASARADPCSERFAALRPLSEGSGGVESRYQGRRRISYPLSQQKTEWSHVYELSVPTRGGGRHRITLTVPDFREDSIYNTGFTPNEIEQGISGTLEKLPMAQIEATHTIRVNPAPSADEALFAGFKGDMGLAGQLVGQAGDGIIDFYPTTISRFVNLTEGALDDLSHEHGHNIAHRVFGSTNPPPGWTAAARADGTMVSRYATWHLSQYGSYAEDFADSIKLYIRSLRDSTAPDEFQHRFAYLDRIFGVGRGSGGRAQISEQTIRKMAQVAGAGPGVSVTKHKRAIDAAYYLIFGGGAGYILFEKAQKALSAPPAPAGAER